MRKISPKSKWLAGIILVVTVIALVFGGCWLFNEPPLISDLTLLADGEINTGTAYPVECVALDPDEDELSYSWSADGGTFNGEGATVEWIAPDEAGNYTISVEVSDGGDEVATEQIIVGVLVPNFPPSIESLTTNCPRVRKGHTATLTCEASDPDGDELTYEWSAERGSLSGEGPVVTWVGPNEYGTFVITVIVTDGRGDEANSGITITVCACGSAC